MTPADTPTVKDLVLIGGGHAHVFVLKNFGMKKMPGVRLTLIARDVLTPYSGMLPGFIAGHYTFEECHIDLRPLAGFAGARLYHDEAVGIDRANRRVLCANRPPVPYDVLSLDIGSRPRQADVPGAADFATPVKPIDRFAGRWEKIVARVMASDGPLRIGLVGGGAGGIELTLAIQFRLRHLMRAAGRDPDRVSFHLVTANGLLPTHNPKVQAAFARTLAARGIAVHLGHPVVAVEPGLVRCANGAEIPLDEILWVTQAGAAPWPGDAGLDCDEAGFVKVRDTLQSLTDPDIFAAGDVAAVVDHPRPKAGVFAVRQGRPLADNLRRALAGEAPQPFVPQREFLSLISTGDKYAIASRGGWTAEGRWLWRLKDWIDRRFMRKFSDLPEMPAHAGPVIAAGVADGAALKEISAIAMRCGGCGAKVGSSVLSRVIGRLDGRTRDDVLIGLGAPDDAAVVRVPAGKAMVHTVDFFRSFVDDPYVFGQIAANHALGDVFAMGAEPQTALAIASVPYGLEAKIEDDLFQMMSGALKTLDAADTALVGGHTSEGAELALGFAINGLINENAILRKAGLAPGQSLILTKPIGTGTLFAAAMRNKAKGAWIDAALASMTVSARDAAACLQRHGAAACTDVTGFGLLGHLVEMVKPSGVDIELDIDAVPLLDGALETTRAGIFSSLQPQNVRLRRAVHDVETAARDPRFALLFDPQTAGGLLASVPTDATATCIDELKRLGYARTAIIGRVLPQSDALSPIRISRR
ncbi:MAG: selenide, water dikinase SelD [Rhodospirillales bacterium]|nr:selenide, water dikinase SelD [Rhodospirillales bacterium]